MEFNVNDDDIVISGISVRLPKSKDADEFAYNLYNKVDMVSDASERWSSTNVHLPKRFGFIDGKEKFDATFFGIHAKQAERMDPQGRMILEHAYAAVLDAGINPKELNGSNTAVYSASCASDTEAYSAFERSPNSQFGVFGTSRNMLANRISFFMNLHGPSFTLDSACSSSITAINEAVNAIKYGLCDAAIVTASMVMQIANTSTHFTRLGMVTASGISQPFDENAAGFVRAEAVSAIFIQKVKDAKRVYARIANTRLNNDGYKPQGIYFPGTLTQQQLFEAFYKDISFDPCEVSYVEGHVTSTKVGDQEECRSIDDFFCANRKEPLLVGSVKSNMGHAEGAAGLCSITKAIVILENGVIPPNLHFNKAREGVAGLIEGRLKVVVENTSLPGPLVAINSFGFGGSNAHALLIQWHKTKDNYGRPNDELPRLVNWRGRTQEAVETVLNKFSSSPLDIEFVALLHNIERYEIEHNLYRGYGLFKANADPSKAAVCLASETKYSDQMKRPVVWLFSGMGSQWLGMGRDLMKFDVFRESIEKCHAVLQPFKVDLIKIITTEDRTIFNTILNAFVGITAMQIALVDMLNALGAQADYIIGHSMGEIGCGYADGVLTLEEAILFAYYRGEVSITTNTIHGSMAAVALGYAQIKQQLPEEVYVACRNSSKSVTISGPSDAVKVFVKHLTENKIFAKEVDVCNIAYHSKHIAEMGPKLLARLKSVIPNPRKRSSKWFSSSVPKCEWNTEKFGYGSAEYYVNNLVSPVLFEDTMEELPKDAIIIEIAPRDLFRGVLKDALPDAKYITFTKRSSEDACEFFLNSLGSLFINGVTINVDKIYPAVKFPVSRGTPMIAPLIKWEHTFNWHTIQIDMDKDYNATCERPFTISLSDDDYKYIAGHVIDDRCLIPATAYLHFVREKLVKMTPGATIESLSVEFENVTFLRATALKPSTDVELAIVIHQCSGRFEISENKTAIVEGTVRSVGNPESIYDLRSECVENDYPMLAKKDFYKELNLRGYNYNGLFQSVKEIRADSAYGKIEWHENWVAFMDCMLQSYIITKDTRALCVPTSIRKIRINPKQHLEALANSSSQYLDVYTSTNLNTIVSGGIEITDIGLMNMTRRRHAGTDVFETYEFVPLNCVQTLHSAENAARVFVQLALEKTPTKLIKFVEVLSTNAEPFIQYFQQALSEIILVSADFVLLTGAQRTFENLKNIDVKNAEVLTEKDCTFILTTNCYENRKLSTDIATSLSQTGYLIALESVVLLWEDIKVPSGFQLISAIQIFEGKTLILYQRIQNMDKGNLTVIEINSHDTKFDWLHTVQREIKNKNKILLAEKDDLSGIIGLTNCLRLEPGCENIRCMLIADSPSFEFSFQNGEFLSQLQLELPINIYKNGKWGTYRHLELNQKIEEKQNENYLRVKTLRTGDMSSLTWVQEKKNVKNPLRVQYAAFNFRDVMVASGRLPALLLDKTRLGKLSQIGIEFAGTMSDGTRCMGMAINGLATIVDMDNIDDLFMWWQIPNSMTIREASTIPVAYITVYDAFFINKQISKGDSILIHCGSGGVGLSAIRVALAYGLTVYTTVSCGEKKRFLLKQYPALQEHHIGNSRDCSFEKMVMRATKGKGVDFVLNSLTEEKFLASFRCLKEGGTFLELGKFELVNNTKIGLGLFNFETSLRIVAVDTLREQPKVIEKLYALIDRDLKAGIIQPLPSAVFELNDIENAFRYISTAKHVGKVLIRIRDNEKSVFTNPVCALPQVCCNPNSVYILVGGLGGYGLELADWLILRGAKKIVLSSRRGITNTYQAYRIKVWKSYGCEIVINTNDVTNFEECKKLLNEASVHGDIQGVFNLAVVLYDKIFENQTSDSFLGCYAPKVTATHNLDQLTRQLCPKLQYFVIFSSVSCGRGNAGQTNYGMSNSIMERIIEKRVKDHLPGKAIQWGAIGDVGILAENLNGKFNSTLTGLLPQPIESCLNVLDQLLHSHQPIVSSMVVAEKHRVEKTNAFLSVLNVIGIKDLKSISINSTLSNLGMDSLMCVEVKQLLEMEFGILKTAQELRNLTVEQLQQISSGNQIDGHVEKSNLLQNFQELGDESMSRNKIVELSSDCRKDNDSLEATLFVPGIEGVTSDRIRRLCKQVNEPVYILQLHASLAKTVLRDLIEDVIEDVKSIFKGKRRFHVIGYSFGTLIAIEITRELEKIGLIGHLTLIDGSLALFKECIQSNNQTGSLANVEDAHLSYIVEQMILDPVQRKNCLTDLSKLSDFNAKLQVCVGYLSNSNYSSNYLKEIIQAVVNRLNILLYTEVESSTKIKCPITLYRPKTFIIKNFDEDYQLAQYSINGKIDVKFLDGNHQSILDNPILIDCINKRD